MQDSKQLELSLKTLAATIFLGVAGDLLLRDVPWGIGFAIYAFVVLAVGVYLHRNNPRTFGQGVLYVIPPALLFASMFAWRDSDDLRVLNGVCFALLIGVFALRVRSGQIGTASITDYPYRLVCRWLGFLSDFTVLVRLEGRSKELGNLKFGNSVAAAARGVLIAAPLLIVFGVLFASADAVFSHFAERAFSFDVGAVCSNFIVFTICLWISGGFLRRIFLAQEDSEAIVVPPKVFKIGITEIAIVLSTLNALFLAFVAIQVRYLFGGHALVQKTAHLSYAEYARQGFFELVTVALLGLVVLVAGHSVLRRENTRDWRWFASLAFALVSLILVVLASAITRMHIYVEVYGITRDRLYATAVLGWVSLIIVWFCATTLRRRPERFAAGAVASLLFVVLALNVMNPDAYIVKLNTTRASKSVDSAYLGQLSDDAVPQLVASLPTLSKTERDAVLATLKTRSKELSGEDWRTWDISAARAQASLQSIHL
jgi:hypothetical protein